MRLLPRRRSLVTVTAVTLCVAVVYLAFFRRNEDYAVNRGYAGALPGYIRAVLPPPYVGPPEHTTRAPRTNVILLSYINAGIHFAGDMFERNTDIFFMFEPFHTFNYLKAIGQTYPGEDLDMEQQPVAEKAKLLADILKCNITYKPYIDYLNDAVHHHLYHSDMHIRHSPPLRAICQRETEWAHAICRNFTAPSVSEECRSYNVTVLRIIRISDLRPYAKVIAETNTKIVQLVRDPRAIFNDKLRAGYNTGTTNQREVCSAIVSNSDNEGEGDIEQAVVRYEQVAMYPEKSAEMIYNFTGIKPSDKVSEWVNQHTSDKIYSPQGRGKTRDSVHPVFQWRLDIPWRLVEEIQTDPQCVRVMKLYGYPLFADETELRNLNLPSLP